MYGNFNNGFNPYIGTNPYQQLYQQPYQQSVPQIATNKTYVSGIEDVKMRVQPNNSDFIYLDNDKSLLYRKTTDGSGKFEVKVYEITEFKGENNPNTPQNIDVSQFVLNKDFRALQDKITALENKVKGNTSNGTNKETTSKP